MSTIDHDLDTTPLPHEAIETDPAINLIGFGTVIDALRKGMGDFWQRPSHYIFLCLIYPIAGLVIAAWTSGEDAFQLLYPIATGFALLGPIAAVGLYELSRRREEGLDTHARHALDVMKSRSLPQILRLGALLAVIYLAWLGCAQALYSVFYGAAVPPDFWAWIVDLTTTTRGWSQIVIGNLVGAVFALAVLAGSAIAFPLLVDRGGSTTWAIRTSLRVFARNPLPMLAWGLIVVVALVLGSLPLLVGLAVVLPVLGHATWHLYRATVV